MPTYLFSSSSWTTTTSTGSLFPSMSTFLLKPIPDADFMLFHGIHRRLFSRMIFDLDREPSESMLVLAFWMWLDIEGYCITRLVKKLLWRLSPLELSLIADETLICLDCIQTRHDYFMFSECGEEIHHLQMLMENKRLSLLFLHQDRERIFSNVKVLLNEVCWRAFKDILQGIFGDSFVFYNPNVGGGSSSRSTSTVISTSMAPVIGMPYYPNDLEELGFIEVPLFAPNEEGAGHGNEMGMPHHSPDEGGIEHGNRMGMPQFAHFEGGVGHSNGVDISQFSLFEGDFGHRDEMGMPHFPPYKGSIGHENEIGKSQLAPIEGRNWKDGYGNGTDIPQFAPTEGRVRHINGMGMSLFAPIKAIVRSMNGIGMSQFASIEGRDGHGIEGSIGHQNGMGMPQFPPFEGGVGPGNAMGMPQFSPIEGGVGTGNGMRMPQFAPIEGSVGPRNGMVMPQFAPIEGGVGPRNGMGMPQFAPIEGRVGHGNAMGMPHFVLNEGVGYGNELGMPHFAPNDGFGHEMNVMGMQHFVPNNGGVHGMGTIGAPGHVVVPSHMVGFGPQIDLNARRREFIARELESMMSHVHISEPCEEHVPADDRTIFLTFSKGYPISENEVRTFFTRRYGDFIEDVSMQVVPRNQQPLYAIVVARRLSDVRRILRGPDDKLKFAINGKHVWMRKYVKGSIPRTPGRGGPVR